MKLNSVFVRVRFLQKTVLHVSGATILALASLFFVSPLDASASTVYQTAGGFTESTIDFPVVYGGTGGATSTPLYSFVYQLPEGLVFDRIQIQVPTSQTGYTKTLSAYSSHIDVAPWSCFNSNCLSLTDYISLSPYSVSNPEAGTLQWLLSTTTTVTSFRRAFYLAFDPNTGTISEGYNFAGSIADTYANSYCRVGIDGIDRACSPISDLYFVLSGAIGQTQSTANGIKSVISPTNQSTNLRLVVRRYSLVSFASNHSRSLYH